MTNKEEKEAQLRSAFQELSSLESRANLVADMANAMDQAQLMRKKTPLVIGALDDLLEVYESMPDFSEQIRGALRKEFEGDLWNPEKEDEIEASVTRMKRITGKVAKHQTVIVKSLRALAKAQAKQADILHSLSLAGMVYLIGGNAAKDAKIASLSVGDGDGTPTTW